MFDFFTEQFMQYALYLGLALAVAAAFLSPYLVLSHQAMIADGIAHISFTGISIGLLLSSQALYFAIPFAIIASIAITILTEKANMQNDASISVVSAFALAIGLIIVTVGDGFNRSIESLLVGSILTVSTSEVQLAIILMVITIVFVLAFYRPLLAMTYDPEYAKFSGVKTSLLKYSLAALTAVFVVIGVKTVGILLISAYTIFPALISNQLVKSFKLTLVGGVVIAIFTIFIGITLSYHLNLPTGSTIVVVYTILLIGAYLLRRILRRN
ncbi:MAG: metal ABC transporter permease [Bacilli bacterium]